MKHKLFLHLSLVVTLFFSIVTTISCGSGNHDATIQTQISSATQSTPELQNVSASVSNGVVTLIGNCGSEKEREKAEKAIKKIDNVKEVVNNISITNDVNVASDGDLKEQVANTLKKYKHIQADVSNAVITLRGNVEKDDLQKLMIDLNSLHPKRIDNQVVVE